MNAILRHLASYCATPISLLVLGVAAGDVLATQGTADPGIAALQWQGGILGSARVVAILLLVVMAAGLGDFMFFALLGSLLAVVLKYGLPYAGVAGTDDWPFATTAIVAMVVTCSVHKLWQIARQPRMFFALLVVVALPALWLSILILQSSWWVAGFDALVAMTLLPAAIIRPVTIVESWLVTTVQSNPKLLKAALLTYRNILPSVFVAQPHALVSVLKSAPEVLAAALIAEERLLREIISSVFVAQPHALVSVLKGAPKVLAAALIAEDRLLREVISSVFVAQPHALVSVLKSAPEVLAAALTAEERLLKEVISSVFVAQPHALVSVLKSAPEVLAAAMIADDRLLKEVISSVFVAHPHALVSMLKSDPKVLAAALIAEKRLLKEVINDEELRANLAALPNMVIAAANNSPLLLADVAMNPNLKEVLRILLKATELKATLNQTHSDAGRPMVSSSPIQSPRR